jgi:hypothetical protein
VPVDPQHVARLREREDRAFAETHRRSAELLERGRRSMPHGVPLAWMHRPWEHIGPAISAQTDESHVDAYLEAFGSFVRELTT